MNAAQFVLLGVLRVYRWVLSPAKAALFGPLGRCRFTPSCSAYALEAVQTCGALRGSWLAVKRLARCHPWGGCGHDPVPRPDEVEKTPGRAPQTPGRCPISKTHPAMMKRETC